MCRLRDLNYETEIKLDLVYQKYHFEKKNGIDTKIV